MTALHPRREGDEGRIMDAWTNQAQHMTRIVHLHGKGVSDNGQCVSVCGLVDGDVWNCSDRRVTCYKGLDSERVTCATCKARAYNLDAVGEPERDTLGHVDAWQVLP